MVHHAPVGAWSSLRFGEIGRGVSVGHESLVASPNADMLVALRRDGVTSAFPFVEDAGAYRDWRFLEEGAMRREVSPCVDLIEGGGVTVRVFTPHAALPNPKRSGNLQYATVPGVLMEVSVDNSASDFVATAFVGLKLHGCCGGGELRPLDWSSKALCGVANSSKWAFATQSVKESVETVLADEVDFDRSQIVPGASTGGVLIRVPAREKRTVMLVFAFYDQGNVTQGIDGRYLYTSYFPRVEAVANFILANSQKILESCSSFDGRTASACGDPQKLAIFSQAMRTYEANSQVADATGVPYFTVVQGESGSRNALSLAVDHLAWELYRNPWVVRNIFDLATTNYAYQGKVRFASSPDSDELRDGGMTFAHDFGFHSCYSPSPSSVGASVTATEDLLNGVYLLTSYALLADDTPWAKTRLPFARELMINMENRDHWDPAQRTGILKGVGGGGETCVLSPLGGVFGEVPGNLYLAVKTFCANMMLTTYYQSNNDLHSADYSYAFAQKTAQAIAGAFDAAAEGGGILPANLLAADTSAGAPRLIAALEPLAVPTYLGLTSTLSEYFPELFNALKAHALACLKGGCVDAVSGGLRLASSSSVVLPGKVVNVLYVLERLFQIDVQGEFPSLWREVALWSQSSADVIDCERRAVIGGVNSSRLIASAVYVKPVERQVSPSPQAG